MESPEVMGPPCPAEGAPKAAIFDGSAPAKQYLIFAENRGMLAGNPAGAARFTVAVGKQGGDLRAPP